MSLNRNVLALGRVRRPGRLAALLAVLSTFSMIVVACGASGGQPTGSGAGGSAGQSPTAGAQSQAGDLQSQITKVPVEGGGSYSDVSVAGLTTMLKSKNFPLINVHIPYEGEIEPTDAFIPYNEIERNLGKLPADKNARIVLYCRSGSMSATAARVLAKQGYTDVYNLDGGMIAWKAAGNPLADKKR